MNPLLVTPSGSIHRSQALLILCIVMLLTARITSAPPLVAPTSHIQPALVALAAQNPDATVRVIVQTFAPPARVADTIIQLGGVVTNNLRFINAIVSELPAKAVLRLGKTIDVRWISLDAPMVKSSCNVCIDTTHLENAYVQSIGASRLWNEAPGYLQGQGIGVAVVDSGINDQTDLYTV